MSLFTAVPAALSLTPTKRPLPRVRLKVSVRVSMMSMPEFERSAREYSARCGLTQLMSYDRSGLPGIWTAVRHWVSVLAGAPGPVQAAYAVPAPTSAGAASIAAIELRKVNLADMCCLLLWVDTTLSQVRAPTRHR